MLTTRQVRGQFNDEVRAAADQLRASSSHLQLPATGALELRPTPRRLERLRQRRAGPVRIFDRLGDSCCAPRIRCGQAGAAPAGDAAVHATQHVGDLPGGSATASTSREHAGLPQRRRSRCSYARPLADVDHTLARVRFFLLLGVLGGTLLALLAGLAIAQRAMRPIAALTDAAREIERTRDPQPPHAPAGGRRRGRRAGPHARGDAALARRRPRRDRGDARRQREFVADASHELRTPLTSVLANLELLGRRARRRAGARPRDAALRSSRRMRRLVGRPAAARPRRRRPRRRRTAPTDLAEVAHRGRRRGRAGGRATTSWSIDAEPGSWSRASATSCTGWSLNLLENAIRHTPPGTRVARGSTRDGDGRRARSRGRRARDPARAAAADLRALRPRRRRRRPRLRASAWRSSARSPSPTAARVEAASGRRRGRRHPLRRSDLPAAASGRADETAPRRRTARAAEPQTSTTTGRTIGRRRSRS